MAEPTPQERLQPSLLDRLTDDEPDQQREPRQRRVLSLGKLRACVLRDLRWLLNTGDLASVQPLDRFPEVRSSVVNYGIPDLTGLTVSDLDAPAIEKALRQAILDFEPRILRKTLKVRIHIEGEQIGPRTVSFDIRGELWAQPVPLQVLLKTDIDLESGTVEVADATGRGGG